MDYLISRLAFQTEKLNYKFRDLDLLMEALTDKRTVSHYQESTTIKKNYQPNDRLIALGDTVLKMVACQYAIMSSKVTGTTKGEWTEWRGAKLMEEKQKAIGWKILNKNERDAEFLEQAVRKSVFTDRVYDEFVKALFGAVFLDSGACDGNGIPTCLKLFQFLWGGMGYLENTEKHSVQYLFENPILKPIWNRWGMYDDRLMSWKQNVLQVDFKNCDFLCEAIIHPTWYDRIRNDHPLVLFSRPDADYRALEFLGDSVLEVILAEYFCTAFPSATESKINHAVEIGRYKTNTYLDSLYQKLELDGIVKMKYSYSNWENRCNFVESIIGAMYLDGEMRKPKEFLLRIFGFKVTPPRTPTLMNLQKMLNYKFRDNQILEDALTSKLVCNSGWPHFDDDHQESDIFIGKTFSNIILVEHDFKYGTVGSGNRPENKLSYQEQALASKQIVEFLQLDKHVKVQIIGGRPNVFQDVRPPTYTWFIAGLLGAAFKDATLAKATSPVRQIVYRLWNPFLNLDRDKTLLGGLHYSAVDFSHQFRQQNFQSMVRYEFKNVNILNAIVPNESIIRSVPVPYFDKFRSMGDSAIGLLTVNYEMKIRLHGISIKVFEVSEVHETQISITIENALPVIGDSMLKYCYGIDQGDPAFTPKLKLSLIVTILGAIYLDMWSEESAPEAKWMDYLYYKLGPGFGEKEADASSSGQDSQSDTIKPTQSTQPKEITKPEPIPKTTQPKITEEFVITYTPETRNIVRQRNISTMRGETPGTSYNSSQQRNTRIQYSTAKPINHTREANVRSDSPSSNPFVGFVDVVKNVCMFVKSLLEIVLAFVVLSFLACIVFGLFSIVLKGIPRQP